MIVFPTEIITDGITRIYGIGGEQMYLIEGEHRAALIDTGTGVGDLHGFVKTLTDLPIVVLITHGHVDHAMGLPQFDEVHMSFLDRDVYLEMCTLAFRRTYIGTSSRAGEVEERDYLPESMYHPLEETAGVHDLKDGERFDLGGITIEAVSCGGHSPGSTMFLIHEKRILIAGDACCFFTMMQGDSCLGLYTYERNLRSVRERLANTFDLALMSHGKLQAGAELLDEVIKVCEEIKAGTDDHIPFGYLGTAGFVAKSYGNQGRSSYARDDGRTGNIVYDPQRIWE